MYWSQGYVIFIDFVAEYITHYFWWEMLWRQRFFLWEHDFYAFQQYIYTFLVFHLK